MRLLVIITILLGFGTTAFATDCISEIEVLEANRKVGWSLKKELEMSFKHQSKDRVMIFNKGLQNKISVYLSCGEKSFKEISSNTVMMNSKLIDDGIGSEIPKYGISKKSDSEFSVWSIAWMSSNFGDKINELLFTYDGRGGDKIVLHKATYTEHLVGCFAGDVGVDNSVSYDFFKRRQNNYIRGKACVEDPETGMTLETAGSTVSIPACSMDAKSASRKFNEIGKIDIVLDQLKKIDFSCK